MKLVNTSYNMLLNLTENQILVLSVENQKVYRELLRDFWIQCQGGEGAFVLSEQEKEIKMSKQAECIYNLYDVNLNDRKILTKLYQELKEQADLLVQEESVHFRQELITYFDKLIGTVPYQLKYNFDFDLLALMKAIEIENDSCPETLLENLMQYIKLLNQICGISLFVLPNLKSYFDEQELLEFYEFAFYQKVYILVIESAHTPQISGEKGWIIDKDLCIIEL